MDVLINVGCAFGGAAMAFAVFALCSIAGKSENNLYLYREISRLRKRLGGSYDGIKKLKAKNRKLNETVKLQNEHIEALEEMADGLAGGQYVVERVCEKVVKQCEKECSEKIAKLSKSHRHEINRILSDLSGAELYSKDLEMQNRNLLELVDNLHARNDMKNIKEVA